jgi:hypothetical protein
MVRQMKGDSVKYHGTEYVTDNPTVLVNLRANVTPISMTRCVYYVKNWMQQKKGASQRSIHYLHCLRSYRGLYGSRKNGKQVVGNVGKRNIELDQMVLLFNLGRRKGGLSGTWHMEREDRGQ